jgi:hypothetical protein
MKKHDLTKEAVLLTLFLPAGLVFASASGQNLILFDFENPLSAGQLQASEAQAAVSEGKLRIETDYRHTWAKVVLKPTAAKWDLSAYQYVTAEVTNTGKIPITVSLSVENPNASYNGSLDRSDNCNTGTLKISGGESGILKVCFHRNPYSDNHLSFIGMRAGPPIEGILDPGNVVSITMTLDTPRQKRSFKVDNITAGGSYDASAVSQQKRSFFPMIDEFGQYIHKDWPGKTHSVEELVARGKEEEKDLAAHPGPDDWNEYGGWQGGPQLEATGFFRVEKYKEKWWLVDPSGRLFWSHGIDCVRMANATPITDREHYFAWLPEADSAFAGFYGTDSRAAQGYYRDKEFKTFDFVPANFVRKYGDNWQHQAALSAHRRLRSWGMNTIANWSDEKTYLMRKTPYVVAIHYRAPRLQGSEGYWGKFPDVFDPAFRSGLREGLGREQQTTAGDPWCIGYFVDNELSWGDDTSLAIATLASPADQPAKRVFIDRLKDKYTTIDNLNSAWKASHTSWDAVLDCQQPPDVKNAEADLKDFYAKLADEYFRICREEVKRIAPNNLYLGCRFAWFSDAAVKASAEYCDVIGFNRYEPRVSHFSLPDGIDKPVIVGEFHFGALDRGLFHPGLVPVKDQQQRADRYKRYVEGALANPLVVGTHWFQYKDQSTTGRDDGENYQIGFVDICDNPYPETIEACRQVGYRMYQLRLGRTALK